MRSHRPPGRPPGGPRGRGSGPRTRSDYDNMLLDERLARPEHLGRESEADVRDAIEVETVRYRQALRKLQVALPGEVPEIVLEPQLANEQNSMPCPYGFGRLIRKPWALHVPPLGFCQHECWCGALLRARDEIVVASGVGWTGLPVDEHAML